MMLIFRVSNARRSDQFAEALMERNISSFANDPPEMDDVSIP